MSIDLTLPAFELDCRQWLVASAAEGDLGTESDGGPVLAVLSTAIVTERSLRSATVVLSIGLLDEPAEETLDGAERCLSDVHWLDGHAQFVVPAPSGNLAVMAEFSSDPNPDPELVDRCYDLVESFRWAC